MTWVLVGGLALLVFLAAVFVFRVPRSGWEVLGAALLVGIAGYALQGSPGLPGAPKAPPERIAGGGTAAVGERQKLEQGAVQGNQHVIIADALARHGQFADAAEVLRGAVDKDPANAEA